MMKKLKLSIFAVVFVATLSIVAVDAQARDQIRVVGSSTVYPFVTVVSEQFGRKTKFRTPVVESTGTGGGLKLFCSGVGLSTPDATNASRRITPSELLECYKNGVNEISEVKIGFDGIVLANSVKSYQYDISLTEVFLALAAKIPGKTDTTTLVPNYYKTWDEINPNFPKTEIRVYGPPSTSGTRDAFVELVMEAGCWQMEAYKLAYQDFNARKKACHEIREDGGYIEAGENDNLIVQKLNANPDSLGIFGFSFLEENKNLVQGSKVSGIAPEHDTIADGSYVISRPLLVYFKLQHIGEVAGIEEFMKEIVSSDAIAAFGYLEEKGLIPLPDEDLEQIQKDVNQGKKLENLAEEEEQVLLETITNIETAAGQPISIAPAK